MKNYSIKDLELLSGIKAHTLRIWEQRYTVIRPKRTATNIRYYTDCDLRKVLNIALLNCNGHKISKIAEMSGEELCKRVREIADSKFECCEQVHALTVAMLDFDEASFCNVFIANSERIGFERTFTKIMFPFLKKIGMLWQSEAITCAQEHFVTCLIRQKLIAATDSLSVKERPDVKTFLLFLPTDELHEISLLFACFLLKKNGQKVIYVGQNLPFDDLISVTKSNNPEFLFTVLTSRPESGNLKTYIDALSRELSEFKILITGPKALEANFDFPQNIMLIPSVQAFYPYFYNS